jgi:hypothetical protein
MLKTNMSVKITNQDYGFSDDVYETVYQITAIDNSMDEPMYILDSSCDGLNNQYYEWELAAI